MTVTMTIEEFDELREAKQEVEEIENLSIRSVRYSSEAYDIMEDAIVWNAIEFVKPLDVESLKELLEITGVRVRFKNISFADDKENEA